MKFKRKLQLQKEVKPWSSYIMLLVSTGGYFPVRFDIPYQIIVWYRNFLHLPFLKCNYLEKGEILRTDALNIDSKFLQYFFLNISKSLIRFYIVLNRVSHCQVKIEREKFLANQTVELELRWNIFSVACFHRLIIVFVKSKSQKALFTLCIQITF